MKVNTKRMIFKMSGKFDWHAGVNWWWVDLPSPRNVRYCINKLAMHSLYTLTLVRLVDQFGKKHGNDLTIGGYSSLEEAQNRAEVREARYEVKQTSRLNNKGV